MLNDSYLPILLLSILSFSSCTKSQTEKGNFGTYLRIEADEDFLDVTTVRLHIELTTDYEYLDDYDIHVVYRPIDDKLAKSESIKYI